MGEPTAHALTQHFSQLVGRPVTFAQGRPPGAHTGRPIYGLYTVLPQETVLLVKADLALLGSFAGLLVGLPGAAVQERLRANTLDELLRDAMHEVLNIASTVVTNEGRAVFKAMATDPVYFENFDAQLLVEPDRKTLFDVSLDEYEGGRFTIFAQLYA